MIWAIMNFILASLSIFIAVLVSQKYFKSEYNHVENMWFFIAFFLFSIQFVINGLSYFLPILNLYVDSIIILQIYGYWIMIIMGFRLRQIHEDWPYKVNKYVRVVVLLATIFSLFIYHLLAVYGLYEIMGIYYRLIFILLSFMAFIVFPRTGYYLFFRMGFGTIGLAHLIELFSLCDIGVEDIHNVSFILSFVGFISVGIALYFIFYSDEVLERRENKERRNKPRRAEDKASF